MNMKISKRILLIGLITIFFGLILVGCDSNEKDSLGEDGQTEQDITKEDENIQQKDEKNKLVPPGEEVVFEDENGNAMFSLKINSVNIADKFIEKKDETFSADPDRGVFESDYEQAVEVNYTYKNIGVDEKIKITSFDIQVADIEGEVSESVGVLKKEAQEIPANMSCTAEAHYALMNKSDKVKVIFSNPMVTEDVIFEVPVNEEL